MDIKAELKQIVGKERVFDDEESLKGYSGDYSLARPVSPNYIVQPENTLEVQGVIKLANERNLPLIPTSSGVHFNGASIPKQGGIVLDLRRMNRILEIDERNRKVKIEAGVTWGQIEPELEKRGAMIVPPLLPHPLRSVVTDYLERENPVISKYEYGEPLLTMEVVWPNGDIFKTGSASAPGYPETSLSEGVQPEGPGSLDFYRLLQGAQGTMGVITWANIKFEYLPEINKTFFIPFNHIEEAIGPIYRIQRKRIGYECLLLNNLNLATILAENWPGDFEALRESLPPWMLILILSGHRRRPEEKIEYEEKVFREIGKSEFPGMSILTSLPGVPGLEGRLPGMLRRAWPEEATYWKHRYKGSCQDLFFITIVDRVPGFIQVVTQVAAKHGYSADEIGCYIQPIENARSCHCEFNFYYNPDDPQEVERIRGLHAEAAESLLNAGALFTRPYGILANLVYSRASEYTMALKKVKGILDPNNIMCPGNLCF
jgi:FAD/FMN-containing dehydrogenase